MVRKSRTYWLIAFRDFSFKPTPWHDAGCPILTLIPRVVSPMSFDCNIPRKRNVIFHQKTRIEWSRKKQWGITTRYSIHGHRTSEISRIHFSFPGPAFLLSNSFPCSFALILLVCCARDCTSHFYPLWDPHTSDTDRSVWFLTLALKMVIENCTTVYISALMLCQGTFAEFGLSNLD